MGSDFMDGATGVRNSKGTVRPYTGGDAAIGGIKCIARIDHAALDQCAKWNAGLGSLGRGDFEGNAAPRLYFVDTAAGMNDIFFLALKPDKVATEFFSNRPRCARSKERINDDIAGI